MQGSFEGGAENVGDSVHARESFSQVDCLFYAERCQLRVNDSESFGARLYSKVMRCLITVS